jgi:hypothetical protein
MGGSRECIPLTIIIASTIERRMVADTLVIAGDGFSKEGHVIKIRRATDGALCGAAGDAPGCAAFMTWACAASSRRKRRLDPKVFTDGMNGLILTPKGALLLYLSPVPEELIDPFKAIGAGHDLAKGAMLAGATAEEAARLCCGHHPMCGGELTVLRLGDESK